MKLSAVILFSLCIQVFASSYGQSAKFNLSLQNSPLSEVIGQLEKQSVYLFVLKYDQSILDKKVNVTFKNATIEEVMKGLLAGTNQSYRVIDRYIAISANDGLKEKVQQPITVKGKVRDEAGVSIPGVTVIIKGTAIGAITDSNGEYKIEAHDKNMEIVFSYIGYQTQSIAINGKSEINIVLVESVELLKEVVVTAMNINRTKQPVQNYIQSKISQCKYVFMGFWG